MFSDEGPKPDRVVTLVHGTWARKAKWVEEGSPLRRAVEARFPPGTTRFEVFRWSGRNSHSARLEAGSELRAFLRDLVGRFPESRLYVVAHSHGGNVALYGLRGLEPADGVAGVVSLGTPFIHCAARDLALVARDARRLLIGLALSPWLVPFFLAGVSDFPMGWYYWLVANFVSAGVGIILVATAVTLIVRRLLAFPVGPLLFRASRSQEALVARLVPTGTMRTPFLCIRTAGDEARLGLTAVDGVERQVRRIDRVMGVLNVIRRWFTFLVLLPGLILGIALGVDLWCGDRSLFFWTGDAWGQGIAAVVLTLACGATLIISFLLGQLARTFTRLTSFTVPGVIGASPIGYGGLGFGSSWLVGFTRRDHPAGVEALTLKAFVMRRPFLSPRLALRHSLLYTDADVLAHVADWMAAPGATPGRAEASPEPSRKRGT